MTIEDTDKRLEIEQLYFQYRKLMYVVAYKILNDHHYSEDAVNESFIRIINSLDKLDLSDPARTKNLLAIICRNVAKDMYKKYNKIIENEEELENIPAAAFDIMSNPEDIVIRKETYRYAKDAIENLPEIYRDSFLLRHVHGLTCQQVADVLSTTIDAVNKRLSRARLKILKTLEKEGII